MLHSCVSDITNDWSDLVAKRPDTASHTVRTVEVLPEGVGWSVHGCGEPLFFRSGRWAENTARRFAQALSSDGHAVDLYIRDRSGSLVGRFQVGSHRPTII